MDRYILTVLSGDMALQEGGDWMKWEDHNVVAKELKTEVDQLQWALEIAVDDLNACIDSVDYSTVSGYLEMAKQEMAERAKGG